MYSFPYLEPVCCSMSSSNYCFLTSIEVSQEAGQVVWYSCLFQNFPQFLVTHTVNIFGMVNKSEIDVFLKLSCNSESHKQTIDSVDPDISCNQFHNGHMLTLGVGYDSSMIKL